MQGSLLTFVMAVEHAMARGFKVEVWSWRHNLNGVYRKMEVRAPSATHCVYADM